MTNRIQIASQKPYVYVFQSFSKLDNLCHVQKRSRIAPKNDPVKFRDLIMVNNKLARLLFYYDPEIM